MMYNYYSIQYSSLIFYRVQLQNFKKFEDSAEALQAGVALNEGKICKPLKKLLKKVFADEVQEQLMVWDAKLGNTIKVGWISCTYLTIISDHKF